MQLDEVPEKVWASVRSLDHIPAPRKPPEEPTRWVRAGDFEFYFDDVPKEDT